MKYYLLDIEEIYKNLKTTKNGLSNEEVFKRLKEYGSNELKEADVQSNISKFLNQFNNIMIIILMVAAIFSAVLSFLNNESYFDSIVIIFIVILNAILGFIQEKKSDDALEKLKQMQEKNCKVIRDGYKKIIPTKDVVIGDLLYLEAGDFICADAIIIESISLQTDESPLTGESISVNKNNKTLKKEVPISLRTNEIYSGTTVTYGKCWAVVIATGMNTELGKIAGIVSDMKKDITPLHEKINNISKFLSLIIVIIILLMFIAGLILKFTFSEILLLSISLAVAAIPEGLPAVITIVLSIGILNMAKKKVIVRKMSSVETLGSTNIICSDKTGTITENKMTAEVLYIYQEDIDIANINYDILKEVIILNNDSTKNSDEYIGDPTEIALYKLIENNDCNISKILENHRRLSEIPFDSNRKMMTTVNFYDNFNRVITKGSFENILNCCNKIYDGKKIIKLNSKIKEELIQRENELSKLGYRIISYAYKDINVNEEANEKDLIFLSLICLKDRARDGVAESIALCKISNIKPIMITGDSLGTAISIAKEIGILDKENEALSGIEIDKMTENELINNIEKYSVYARVSPQNKLDIVNAWQKKDKIVAMTGDGVNDAPAIKKADIGIGMGRSGTEVSKSVSDIILTDDGFSSIVDAIKEGRRIYDNIRNVLVYLITGNISEVIVVFCCLIFGYEIFLPIQLLYVNLITDSLPAIGLAFEKESDDIMLRKTREKSNTFFSKFIIFRMLFSSLFKTVTILLIFFASKKFLNLNIAINLSFMVLIFSEMFFAYSCKNLKYSVLNKKIFTNKKLNIIFIILLVIQFIMLLTPLNNIFKLSNVSFIQILLSILISLVLFIIDELSKKFINDKFKDN